MPKWFIDLHLRCDAKPRAISTHQVLVDDDLRFTRQRNNKHSFLQNQKVCPERHPDNNQRLRDMRVKEIKNEVNYTNVRECRATTMVPFTTSSPFSFIHRPKRCSWPIPATKSTVLDFDGDGEVLVALDSPP